MKKINLIVRILFAIIFLSNFSLAQKKITSDKAIDHIGENCIVKGVVKQVFISKKGTIFLNLDDYFPDNNFSGVIFKSDAGKFRNIKSYENKVVEIKGKIKEYQGKTEIVIKSEEHIRVVKE